MLAMLRDVLRYDVDGVCLLYNRRPPYVDYEEPLIEGFKQSTAWTPATWTSATRGGWSTAPGSSRPSCAGCASRWTGSPRAAGSAWR